MSDKIEKSEREITPADERALEKVFEESSKLEPPRLRREDIVPRPVSPGGVYTSMSVPMFADDVNDQRSSVQNTAKLIEPALDAGLDRDKAQGLIDAFEQVFPEATGYLTAAWPRLRSGKINAISGVMSSTIEMSTFGEAVDDVEESLKSRYLTAEQLDDLAKRR